MLAARSHRAAHPASWSRVVAYYRSTRWQYRLTWSGLHLHYGYYDRRARTHRRALDRMVEVMAERAHLTRGQRVLDAGCGVGGTALALARSGVRVTGITVVPEQVEEARRRARGRGGTETLQFLQADFTDTGLAAGSFDVVWALESVCYAPCKEDFFREARRVLRPGGVLVMADGVRSARPLPGEGERLLTEWARGWAVPDLDTERELRHEAQAAGLRQVRVEDITVHVMPSVRRLGRLAAIGLALGAPLCSPANRANVRSAYLQRQLFERQWVRYLILTARRPPR